MERDGEYVRKENNRNRENQTKGGGRKKVKLGSLQITNFWTLTI